MIKYTIICPNCGETKTFEKEQPSHYERQFCDQSCGTSYRNKQTWADPIVRAKRLAGMEATRKTEEYKATIAASWTEERRAGASQRAKDTYFEKIGQPGAYEKMCETKRSEACRELARQQAFERWEDPNFHKQAVETLKETHNTPEYRKAASKRAQERWDDPIKGLEWAQSQSRRPTKPELALLDFLEYNGYSNYIYTGDGSFLIGRKNPDFICFELKTIIEMFGAYWHEKSEIAPRVDYFANYGFQMLVIWDYELDDEKHLLLKLDEFHQGMKLIE